MSVKKYAPELKAKIALESLKSSKSYVELASEYKVPKTNVKEWHNKLVDNAVSIFNNNDALVKKNKSLQNEIANLYNVIGELTVEQNFYKKKFLALQQTTEKI